MLIEFDTVRSSLEESYQKSIEKEMGTTPDFYNTEDYKGKITIDMDRVAEFTSGRVYYNDNCYECVYVYDYDGVMSPNLLVSYQDFKSCFENATGKKIHRFDEI